MDGFSDLPPVPVAKLIRISSSSSNSTGSSGTSTPSLNVALIVLSIALWFAYPFSAGFSPPNNSGCPVITAAIPVSPSSDSTFSLPPTSTAAVRT